MLLLWDERIFTLRKGRKDPITGPLIYTYSSSKHTFPTDLSTVKRKNQSKILKMLIKATTVYVPISRDADAGLHSRASVRTPAV